MPSWLNDIFAPLTDLQNHPEMLHAAAIHLPLALAILGFPLALLAIIPWKHERAVRVTAIASYLTLLLAATLAVNSGENVHTLLPSTLPEYIWDDINSHESLARKVWIGAFVTTLFLVISLTPVKKIALSSTLVAAIGAAVTLAIVIQVGHQGGKLVYEHGLGTPPLYVEVHQLAQSKPAQSIPVKSTNTVDTIAEELEPVTYAANIQPILQEYCYGCHSSKERKGELDLSTLDGILAGGEKDGPPIVFGNPDASPLIDYVRGKRQPQMPKDEPPLNNNHISLMERWILTSTPETIRSEIIASNGDPGAVKDLYDAVDRKSAPAIDQLAKLTRTRPNPLFNFDISRLEKRSVFLAQRGKKKLDPLVETTEKEAHISELESSQKEKLGQLNAPRSELKKNYERIFSEDGTVIWPNPEYLKLLKILRLDVLSERVTPPANAIPSTVASASIESYSLVEKNVIPRLRRDLRKRWIPAPPVVPVTNNHDNPIDAFIAKTAEDNGLSFPNRLTSNTNFLRRVYIDLIGIVPPAEVANAFLNDTRTDARSRLIDDLLTRNEDYAANWVPFWEDALCSSQNQNQESGAPMGVRADYRPFIYDAFLQNKPFDTWVRELIDPFDINRPRHYIIVDSRTELIQSASNVAQVFLGTGMKCASCHNHFSNDEWTQTRFLEFAGFFTRDDLELIRCEQPTGRTLPARFPWDLPGIDIDPPSGVDQVFERPSKMALLMTDPANPRFARSIINRLWKRYLGLGFYEPADDYRKDSYVSHPELLEWLANDLILHNFDLKHTIQLILNSKTYQQAYDPALEDHFSLNNPDSKRFFRSPSLRSMWTEQLIDSIHALTGAPWKGEHRTYHADDVTPFMAALGRPTSREEVSTSRLNDIGIVSGLELLNSTEYHALIYASPIVNAMAQAWQQKRTDVPQLINTIYLSTLSRFPDPQEENAAASFLHIGLDDQPTSQTTYANALGDMVWALVTSPEFQFIH